MSFSVASESFKRELSITQQWLMDTALPFWSRTGTDLEGGGFYERLNPDGTIPDDPRRSRLVARQIYVFATARELGWEGPALQRVAHGLTFLLENCIQPDGALVASVAPDGRVVDDSFTLYDYAFALFALAAAARVSPDRAATLESRARALLATLDKERRSTDGRGYQDDPSLLKSNPHMHLLEAAIAWTCTSADPVWRAMADRLADLCVQTFIDSRCDAVREYFDPEWTPVEQEGHLDIEPGHQFEWAWLLMDWAMRSERPDLLAPARRIFRTGEVHGVSSQGLAVNTIGPDHRVIDDRHRLWPQTERLKAKTALFKLAGEADRAAALNDVAAALKALRRYFDHPIDGAWWEHIGPDGTPAIEPSRASSLYHIICAIAEADSLVPALDGASRATADVCAS